MVMITQTAGTAWAPRLCTTTTRCGASVLVLPTCQSPANCTRLQVQDLMQHMTEGEVGDGDVDVDGTDDAAGAGSSHHRGVTWWLGWGSEKGRGAGAGSRLNRDGLTHGSFDSTYSDG